MLATFTLSDCLSPFLQVDIWKWKGLCYFVVLEERVVWYLLVIPQILTDFVRLVVLVSRWYCLAFWDLVIYLNGVHGCGHLPPFTCGLFVLDPGLWYFSYLFWSSLFPQWDTRPFLDHPYVIHRLWNPRVVLQTHMLSLIYLSPVNYILQHVEHSWNIYRLTASSKLNWWILPSSHQCWGSPTTTVVLPSFSPCGSILMRLWRSAHMTPSLPLYLSSGILQGQWRPFFFISGKDFYVCILLLPLCLGPQ